MKKLFIFSAVTIGTLVSAFPFRTSCGKIVQVSQTIANNMSQNQLANYLNDVNAEQCPQHANSTTLTVIYYPKSK